MQVLECLLLIATSRLVSWSRTTESVSSQIQTMFKSLKAARKEKPNDSIQLVHEGRMVESIVEHQGRSVRTRRVAAQFCAVQDGRQFEYGNDDWWILEEH